MCTQRPAKPWVAQQEKGPVRAVVFCHLMFSGGPPWTSKLRIWFLSTQQQDKQLHQKESLLNHCPILPLYYKCSMLNFRAVNVVEFSEGLAEISPQQALDSPGNGEVGCFSSGLYWPRWPQFHMRWAAPLPGFEGARSHISSYFDICLGEF